MDIVICLASKDYHIIKKVIPQARIYLQEHNDQIYLITNHTNNIFFSNNWLKKHHVTLIDEDQMLPGLSMKRCQQILQEHFTCNKYPGWYLQQFLKMGFALTSYAQKEYLIWDSDTFPLHTLRFKDTSDKYIITIKDENHTPYFNTLKRLLGYGKLCKYSFIAEHMPIKVDWMRELITHIEKTDIKGNLWFEKILYATSGQDEQAFSEFETYGSYLSHEYPNSFIVRPLRTLREGGMMWGRGVSIKTLNILANMGFDTASFELRHIPPFPNNIPNWTERCWLAILRKLKVIQ